MTKDKIELTRSSLRLIVEGKSVTVGGEAYLPGHGSPDFVVYSDTLTRWDDGPVISADERRHILERIAAAAVRQGIQVEIE